MSNHLIRAEDITKEYTLPAEEITAANRVSLEIEEGEFVSLMGPSGSGKTTLLDVMGYLTRITSGRLTVLGKDVSTAGERELVAVRCGRVGFVFQDFLLIPTLTALENVELPLRFARQPTNRGRGAYLLGHMGLGHMMHRLTKELSGGERQRVALARALVASPAILFADEPTGNLDTRNSVAVFELFQALNREEGVTIVVATHDEEFGSRASRVIRLVDGRVASDTRRNGSSRRGTGRRHAAADVNLSPLRGGLTPESFVSRAVFLPRASPPTGAMAADMRERLRPFRRHHGALVFPQAFLGGGRVVVGVPPLSLLTPGVSRAPAGASGPARHPQDQRSSSGRS